MPAELHEATFYAPKVLDSQVSYSHSSHLLLWMFGPQAGLRCAMGVVLLCGIASGYAAGPEATPDPALLADPDVPLKDLL